VRRRLQHRLLLSRVGLCIWLPSLVILLALVLLAPPDVQWRIGLPLAIGLVIAVYGSLWVSLPGVTRSVLLAGQRCPACGQSLRGVPPMDDGLTVCPECGHAWRAEEG
jgi:hypothetical protein